MQEHSGDRLRRLAKEQRLRPADLAKELKESSQNINAWFNRGVPQGKVGKVAELLQCSELELRTGKKDSSTMKRTAHKEKQSAIDQELATAVQDLSPSELELVIGLAKNIIAAR